MELDTVELRPALADDRITALKESISVLPKDTSPEISVAVLGTLQTLITQSPERTFRENVVYEMPSQIPAHEVVSPLDVHTNIANHSLETPPDDSAEVAYDEMSILPEVVDFFAASEVEFGQAWLEEYPPNDIIKGSDSDEPVLHPVYELDTQDLLLAAEQVETAGADWSAELTKEPQEVYEVFTEALSNFVALLHLEASVDDEADDRGLEPEVVENIPSPPPLLMVVERLTILEPETREVAGRVMKNITGAVHGIRLLEARHAGPEQIAAVQLQLEAFCQQLFETLGMEYGKDYDEKTIRYFASVMLHPAFRPPQPFEQAVDLERAGTHEAKRYFPGIAGGLDEVEHRLRQLIGRFALAA
jgi:hypothetical protein